MADVGKVYAAIKNHYLDSTLVPQSVYDDEVPVRVPTSIYGWKHGTNIPFGALCLAWRGAILGQLKGYGTEKQYRDLLYAFFTQAGMGHGEEFSRIYSQYLTIGGYFVSKLAERKGDTELINAVHEYMLARAGFMGVTSAINPLGEMPRSYNDLWGPLQITCDLPPAYKQVHTSCQFGKRSWSKWHETGSTVHRWVHLSYGGLDIEFEWMKKYLSAGEWAVVEQAMQNNPDALHVCTQWAKKRLPRSGVQYVMERYTTGLLFYTPENFGASTAPGELCKIVYSQPYNIGHFYGTRSGVRQLFDEDCTVTKIGNDYLLENKKTGKRITANGLDGELIYRFVIQDGSVVDEYVAGHETPVPTTPTNVKGSDLTVNVKNSFGVYGEGFFSATTSVRDHPNLIILVKDNGPNPWGTELLRQNPDGSIDILSETSYGSNRRALNLRVFFNEDGHLGFPWFPAVVEDGKELRYKGLFVEHAFAGDEGRPYDPANPTGVVPGSVFHKAFEVKSRFKVLPSTTLSGRTLHRVERVDTLDNNREVYVIGWGDDFYGYTTWETYPNGVFDRGLYASIITAHEDLLSCYGVDEKGLEGWLFSYKSEETVDQSPFPTERPRIVYPSKESPKRQTKNILQKIWEAIVQLFR